MQELRAQIQAQLKLADHLRKLGESGGLLEKSIKIFYQKNLSTQNWMKLLKPNSMLFVETLQSIKENMERRLELMN